MLDSVRIIAGTFRRRTLEAPPGLDTRPTSDRLRETLFNVLVPRIGGANFLDLYAGSGAVGIEALSRGAAHATFVEQSPKALKVLLANLEKLGLTTGFRVHASAVRAFFRKADLDAKRASAFDLVFLDPPYDAAEEYAATLGLLGGATGLLAENALIIAEHRKKQPLELSYGSLKQTRLLEQGDAALSFYSVRREDV